MNLITKLSNTNKRFLQQYGHLIVISFDKNIVGISENFGKLIDEINVGKLLKTSFVDFATTFFGYDAQKIMLTVDKVRQKKSSPQLIFQVIKGKSYYLRISCSDDHICLEWEIQKRKSISAHEMDELGFLFEKSPADILHSLCRSIQNLINYDRVFVFSMSENRFGHVVAEYSKDGENLFEGQYFSPAFMTDDIIHFYDGCSCRFCPNIFTELQGFFTVDSEGALPDNPYLPFPPLHDFYLKQLAVTSVIVYPIHIDGELWGFVTGHNKKEKDIDMQKRKLCYFVVQNAIGKYESMMKEQLLGFRERMKDAESQLKEKLLFSRTINCGLVQSMALLCTMPSADGLALYHKGDLYRHGICPPEQQLVQIVDVVKSQPKRPIFKDNNFGLRYGKDLDGKLPFSGLMTLHVGQYDDHFILWFRKETACVVTQISPAVEKAVTVDEHAPKLPLYVMWKEMLLDTALPWNENDLDFVKNLDRLINNAIITKAREYEKLNEELISLNNELEMLTYTLSHDLRNPLSIVKMGIQFLDSNADMSPQTQQKWRTSILDGVERIEGMINQLLHLSSTHHYRYSTEPVPMTSLIKTLCNEAKMLHQSPHCRVVLEKLLPLWGEKNILYQIFLNIIGNAVKYSAKADSPEICISSRQEGEHIIYIVRDNGIGIPPDQIDRIFDLFQRASNSGNFKGSGLGLCLVKRIMSKLGGKIEISSSDGDGTKVILAFPSIGEFPESIAEV